MDENEAEVNPLVRHAAEQLVAGWAQAFDEIFSRPDAPQLIAGYLDGKINFMIERSGVTILTPDRGGE